MKMCACGKPLHYSHPYLQELMEKMVAQLGERIEVQMMESGRRFLVPRHYVALHGLREKDLSTLGFEEVS